MQTKTAEIQMMKGSGQQPDYAVVARRGDIALGVKFLGIVPGEQMNMPGRIYVHARLRSAPAGSLFEAADEAAGVTQFPTQLALDEAWPDIAFTKLDGMRASTVCGIFVRGSVKHDPQKLLAELESGTVSGNLAAFILGKAGADNVVLREKQLAEWFQAQLTEIAGHTKKAVAMQQAMQSAMAGVGEGAGFHAAQLKAIYDAHMQAGESPEGAGEALD